MCFPRSQTSEGASLGLHGNQGEALGHPPSGHRCPQAGGGPGVGGAGRACKATDNIRRAVSFPKSV